MNEVIIVTGGAGFIGSNLIESLNRLGYKNIVLSDFLKNGYQVSNISHLKINDFVAPDELCDFIRQSKVDKIFHLGACSDTTEWNGELIMQRNYSFSKKLLNSCATKKIPFIYASSASVYGRNKQTREHSINERPLNIYGFSKLLFDNYVRSNLKKFDSLVCGLRYFNVYGSHEEHKKEMASVIFHFNKQVVRDGRIKIFKGSHGFLDGEHHRDFVEVGDAVNLTVWLSNLDAKDSGIYNCGTGVARSFNEVASLVIEWHGKGMIEYVEFPKKLHPFYQPYTCADSAKTISLGYKRKFKSIEEGIKSYLNWLNVD